LERAYFVVKVINLQNTQIVNEYEGYHCLLARKFLFTLAKNFEVNIYNLKNNKLINTFDVSKKFTWDDDYIFKRSLANVSVYEDSLILSSPLCSLIYKQDLNEKNKKLHFF
jgi:hypothetical protein